MRRKVRPQDIMQCDWFIVDIKPKNTKWHNGLIYHVSLLNFHKQELLVYVDPTNENWVYWRDIVYKFKAGKGLVIENIAKLRDKKGVIQLGKGDGDSIPIIVCEEDHYLEMWDDINDKLLIDPQRAIRRSLFEE